MLLVASMVSMLMLLSYFFLYSLKVWFIELDFNSVSLLDMSVVIVFDMYSLLFFFVVTLISSMIYFFSQFYMDGEKNMKSFILLLSCFVISMVFLIFSPNLIFLLLGWDGLGVTSYFLVVYYKNYSSSIAGMLTFLINRVGDVFFFLSICLFSCYMDWNFVENKYFYSGVSIFLILTFITKSAQIPFSSWLPAAMSAPTPVSSLVHSSTLVTAGVYLMIRFSNLLVISESWLLMLSIFTICMAGLMANFEWDLKKIIAFSTLSQLGFMIASFCCSMVVFCFFHLLIHALFKASLFMCSGVIIHSFDNNQEFRNSQSIMISFPLLNVSIVICLLCLCGFPFTSGFFSKDLILDGSLFSIFLFFVFLMGVIFTFSYSLRFCLYILSSKVFSRNKLTFLNEKVWWVLCPISLLVLCALIFGNLWMESITCLSILVFVSSGWKMFYWGVLVQVLMASMYLFHKYYFLLKKYFLSHMWFLINIFSLTLFRFAFFFSRKIILVMDQGWLEFLGPSGLLNLNMLSLKLIQSFCFFFVSFFFFMFYLI